MGKAMSRLNKQFYRFNAENRAHREIAKEKLAPAPRHPSTEKALEQILKETQHIKEQAMMKDPNLDDYLKKVYVKSHDPVEEKRKKPSERGQLPLSRTPPVETELGYYEPSVIPKGRVTLLKAMEFLAAHQADPQLYNVAKICNEYSLFKEDVESTLEYFSTFKIHIKEDKIKIETPKERVLQFFGQENKPVLLPEKPAVQRKPES